MFDKLLTLVVVFAPTGFALGLELIDEQTRKNPYWRIGVIAFGICLSGLTWCQISREASARESEIKKTSQQVAAETSKQVTKAVTEQYSQMVAEQKQQITDLQSQLAAQGKDVTAIKHSNIVTGKSPIEVKVAEQGANLNWNQEQTELADGKPTVTVNFRVDNTLNLPAFVAICDRPCKPITASAGVMSHRREITWPGQPNLAGTFFDMPKPLPAGTVCMFRIASADSTPVRVQAFRILKENEVPMELR